MSDRSWMIEMDARVGREVGEMRDKEEMGDKGEMGEVRDKGKMGEVGEVGELEEVEEVGEPGGQDDFKVYHKRGVKREKLDFIEARGSVRFVCTLCSTFLNSSRQAEQHNRGEKHVKFLKKLGLPQEHSLEQYLQEKRRLSLHDNLVVKKQPTMFYGKEAASILEDLRLRGVDIPLVVKVVIRVEKISNFNASNISEFDFEDFLVSSTELIGSVVVLDGEEIVGILIAQGIPPEPASDLCRQAKSLWGAGGYVERSKDKFSEPMAMFGYCYAQTFARYTHPIARRQKGLKKNSSSKQEEVAIPEAAELELFGDIFAEEFCKYISKLFPRQIQTLLDLYDGPKGLGRMGTTPFSGLGITQDYSSMPHLDTGDYGCGFIAWFLERTKYMGKGLTTGGEFFLPAYGLYFRPQHGTIFTLMAKTTYHATRRNVGFTQVAACGYTKLKLVTGGRKRTKAIGLG